jgi:hypothetical protein
VISRFKHSRRVLVVADARERAGTCSERAYTSIEIPH